MNKINTFFSRFILTFFCAIVILITLLYVAYYFSGVYTNYRSLRTDIAVSNSEMIRSGANGIEKKLSASALRLQELTNRISRIEYDEAVKLINYEVDNTPVYNIQIISDGEVTSAYGEGLYYYELSDDVVEDINKMISEERCGFSRIYCDELCDTGSRCISYYCPSDYVPDDSDDTDNDEEKLVVTGIIGMFHIDEMFGFSDYFDSNSALTLASIIDKDGISMEEVGTGQFSQSISSLYDFMSDVSVDNDRIQQMRLDVGKGEDFVSYLGIGYTDFYITYSHINSIDKQYMLVCFYSSDMLEIPDNLVYGKGVYVLAVLCFLSVIAIAVFIFTRLKNRSIIRPEFYDAQYECLNYNGFLVDAQKLVDKYKHSRFSVVYISVKNLKYYSDTYGKEKAAGMMKHIALIIKKSLNDMETYGHVMNESFCILIRYTDVDTVSERIKLLSSVISAFDFSGDNVFKAKLSIGVYVLDDSQKATELADATEKARIACRENEKLTGRFYVVYDSTINDSYAQEAKIESKMDKALVEQEFKLFFQPKYDLINERLDSAEVLVRWFESTTGNYAPPDDYVGLFETNGFIVKLDHYIFVKTCEFLTHETSIGDRVIPLSVNVSRVTALQPGFVEFYISTKVKYRMPDNFITLEFTESFAHESYEVLQKTVAELKDAGFMCSVDDFGVGYSAMNILKELAVDELKIDKALLKRSDNPDKDDVVLNGIVSIAKSLNIKTVQEGVETEEDLARVRAYGCNIIQGYYYSKPIPEDKFVQFIKDKG